jgi:hypothetical protein
MIVFVHNVKYVAKRILRYIGGKKNISQIPWPIVGKAPLPTHQAMNHSDPDRSGQLPKGIELSPL